MRLLVAGSSARVGLPLGAALARRGHSVVLADRFDREETLAAAKAWRRRPRIDLALGSLVECLRPASLKIDATIVLGDARDAAFDAELTLAAVDAISASGFAVPIVRLADLPPGAGAEDELVVVRAGAASLRDRPLGIPESRTAGVLAEADRALRLSAVMRDEIAIVVRTAELLDSARLASSRVLAGAAGLARATTLEVIDADTLAGAVETMVRRASDLEGQILHVTAGPEGRITAGALLEQLAGVAFDDAPRAAPRALVLDDARSRELLGWSACVPASQTVARSFGETRRRLFETAAVS